ncbi:MAG: tetratricopeptide repeat protein [Pseudomonadota bacterium]
MDEYFDLGTYERTVTTDVPEAEVWFNRGLNWCYAFHHAEAIRCFDRMIALDPACPMGHWGKAYATGPYYNIPWAKMSAAGRVAALEITYEHSQRALELAASGQASDVEKALCEALTSRFQAPQVADTDILSDWDDAYAEAMRRVHARHADDYDVAALCAEALIVRTPWQLWDLENRVAAQGTDTVEAIGIVERGLAEVKRSGAAAHPGLLHFYIHIMEMSPEPEKALEAGYELEALLPDAGHLVHMPSHIYVLCGLYERTITSNQQAVVADEKYLQQYPELGIFHIYRLHNLHFQVYGGLFSGQYQPAIRAAELMCASVQPDYLRVDNAFLVNYLEAFYGMKAHVQIRFGKWQAILDEPLPAEPALFCVSSAFWEYAKGIAHAVLGNIAQADQQRSALRQALARIPEQRLVFHNEARDIVAIAVAMLDGEYEYRRENYADAFEHLRRAVHLYDTLNYSEPWSWMQPPRHALGALLLEQGHVEEAAEVYKADLGLDATLVRPSQHPDNVWSLHGYAECCERLGDHDGHQRATAALAKASAVADIPITASCFCRKSRAAG